MKMLIGVDIGATNTRVIVAKGEQKISSVVERTEHDNIITQLKRHIDKVSNFEGIGISSIGPLDSNNGVILNPANSTIRNLHIVEILKQEYNVPALLLNDCVAAVVGERFLGAGKSVENLVYITLSTGIGAGVIADDKLVLGKDGNAHEVGHWTLDFNSELLCGCGGRGHWESFAAGKNIDNFAKHLLNTKYRKEAPNNGMEIKILDAAGIFGKAKEGDKYAGLIVRDIAKVNAIGIANVINAYDPELITIGGSVMVNNSELLLGAIKEELSTIPGMNRMPQIKVTTLGDEICAIGALASITNFDWVQESLKSNLRF